MRDDPAEKDSETLSDTERHTERAADALEEIAWLLKSDTERHTERAADALEEIAMLLKAIARRMGAIRGD